VYHDCPLKDSNYPHDWSYIWIVYDTKAKKPAKVYYDFHGLVKGQDFEDVPKDINHPYAWVDAGGHRYFNKEDINIVQFLYTFQDYLK
jgi:hypothetical protein